MTVAAPAFNEAHPPFASDVDVMPPTRTEAATLGTSTIDPIDFDLVRDPAYPWHAMPETTPREKQARQAVRDNQRIEVAEYVVRREHFWELAQRLQFAEQVEVEVVQTQGIETTHEETATRSRTEVIGLTLGLELSGDLFRPSPAKRSLLPAYVGRDRAQTSAEFTYNLTNHLEFQRKDAQTYKSETQVTTRTVFAPQAVYFIWRLSEALLVERRDNASGAVATVSDVIAATGFTWTDKLVYGAPEGPR